MNVDEGSLIAAKPASAEKLDAFERGPFTSTVADNEAMSAGHVKHREVLRVGGVGTRAANVSELKDMAKGGKGNVFERVAIPSLRKHRCQLLVINARPVPECRGEACSYGLKVGNACTPNFQKSSCYNGTLQVVARRARCIPRGFIKEEFM